MVEGTGAPAQGATPSPPRLTAGGLVSGGRYQLLEPHGGVAGQAFWRARDKRLGRDVALTFIDPLPGEEPPGSATGVLDRTVDLTGVYSDGLARVLDVIRGRAGGIVVSEWVPGRSLAAASSDPDPDSAVTAVWGLADAASRAEENGLVLGLDSPDRVRLTPDGRALLAFPGVSASADTRGDVRGLGSVLYALLTGAWPEPLPEGSDSHSPLDGRPGTAPVDDDDEPLDPTLVGSGVPPEHAVLAMRSLDGSSVSSAATVRSLISDRLGRPADTAAAGSRSAVPASARPAPHAHSADSTHSRGAARVAAGSTAVDSPVSSEQTPDDQTPSDQASYDRLPYDEPDADTQKRRWQIMAGTSAAAVVVVALLAAWMLGALTGGGTDTPLAQQLDAIERAAQASRSSESTDPSEESGETEAEPAAAPPSTPVTVSGATSWQPSSSPGTAENSAAAANVADGDRSTSWSTDTYLNQLGDSGAAFKPGVGLMLSLEPEQETRSVVLYADEGVGFEVRSADSASPDSLADTTLLGKGTVRGGSATVTIAEPRKSGHLLVWVTTLATSGPQAYQADVTEVELLR